MSGGQSARVSTTQGCRSAAAQTTGSGCPDGGSASGAAVMRQAERTWQNLDVHNTRGGDAAAAAAAHAAGVDCGGAAAVAQAAYQERQQEQGAEYGEGCEARFGA